MKKHLILLICFYLILTLSSVCYGRESYPLGGLSREQLIEKYFAGRTLDPIEGIWEYRAGEYFIVVNINALKNQKEQHTGYDYLMISVNYDKSDYRIYYKLGKTTSPFIYQVDDNYFFTILSPISMVVQERHTYVEKCYSRSYPQFELKSISN